MVNWALPIEQQGTFGLGLSSQRLDVKGYDDNGAPTRNLWAGETLLTAGWGQTLKDLPLLPGLQTGASLKGFQKKLGENSSSIAVMTDLGLLYETRSGPFQGLRSGFILQRPRDVLKLPVGKRAPADHRQDGLGLAFPGGLDGGPGRGLRATRGPSVPHGFRILGPGTWWPSAWAASPRRPRAPGSPTASDSGTDGTTWTTPSVPAGDLGASHRVSLGVRFGQSEETSSGPARLLYEAGLELYKQEKL